MCIESCWRYEKCKFAVDLCHRVCVCVRCTYSELELEYQINICSLYVKNWIWINIAASLRAHFHSWNYLNHSLAVVSFGIKTLRFRWIVREREYISIELWSCWPFSICIAWPKCHNSCFVASKRSMKIILNCFVLAVCMCILWRNHIIQLWISIVSVVSARH